MKLLCCSWCSFFSCRGAGVICVVAVAVVVTLVDVVGVNAVVTLV